jgi:hypothetical protein
MNPILDEEMPWARWAILLKHYCATYRIRKAGGRSAEHSVIFAASGKSRPASQANPDKPWWYLRLEYAALICS